MKQKSIHLEFSLHFTARKSPHKKLVEARPYLPYLPFSGNCSVIGDVDFVEIVVCRTEKKQKNRLY